MTTDERLHFLAGYGYGLWLLVSATLRFKLTTHWIDDRIISFDRWAWKREEKQHEGHPHMPDLSPGSIAEAKAWGQGARWATGLDHLAFPDPPYPA